MYVCIYLQAYRKLDDMATKQTETLRKLTKQVSDLLENCCKTEKKTRSVSLAHSSQFPFRAACSKQQKRTCAPMPGCFMHMIKSGWCFAIASA